MTNTVIFFFALKFTICFFSRLATWMVIKIAPQNCKKELTQKDIFITNLIMSIGLFLWTILFYNLTNN